MALLKMNNPGCGSNPSGCGCTGGCGGSPATFNVNVKGCGSINFPGITVNAVQGATTISGTTDASGNVSLSITAAGSWTITAVAPSARFTNVSTFQGVTCGGTYGINLVLPAATGFHCCPTTLKAMPDTLSGTDANGAQSFTRVAATTCRWFYFSGANNGGASVQNVEVRWNGTDWTCIFDGFLFTPSACGSVSVSTSNDPINFTVTEADFPTCTTLPSTFGISLFPLTVTF